MKKIAFYLNLVGMFFILALIPSAVELYPLSNPALYEEDWVQADLLYMDAKCEKKVILEKTRRNSLEIIRYYLTGVYQYEYNGRQYISYDFGSLGIPNKKEAYITGICKNYQKVLKEREALTKKILSERSGFVKEKGKFYPNIRYPDKNGNPIKKPDRRTVIETLKSLPASSYPSFGVVYVNKKSPLDHFLFVDDLKAQREKGLVNIYYLFYLSTFFFVLHFFMAYVFTIDRSAPWKNRACRSNNLFVTNRKAILQAIFFFVPMDVSAVVIALSTVVGRNLPFEMIANFSAGIACLGLIVILCSIFLYYLIGEVAVRFSELPIFNVEEMSGEIIMNNGFSGSDRFQLTLKCIRHSLPTASVLYNDSIEVTMNSSYIDENKRLCVPFTMRIPTQYPAYTRIFEASSRTDGEDVVKEPIEWRFEIVPQRAHWRRSVFSLPIMPVAFKKSV